MLSQEFATNFEYSKFLHYPFWWNIKADGWMDAFFKRLHSIRPVANPRSSFFEEKYNFKTVCEIAAADK